MRRGWIITGVAILGACAVALSAWRMSRRELNDTGQPAGDSVQERDAPESQPTLHTDADGRQSRYVLQVDGAGPEFVAEELGVRVSEAPAVADGAELAEAVEDTLAALLVGGSGEILSFYDLYGIEPPAAMLSDPDFAARSLARSHAVVAHARFDPGGVVVSDAFIDEPPAPGFNARTSKRPEGRAFLDDMPVNRRRVAEVAMPVVLHGQDGAEFEAIWRLRYTFNPEAGQWVLTEHRVEGIPGGVLAPAPPI